MISIAPQFTQRFYAWTAWKNVNISKGGIVQYDDDGLKYTIYFYNGPEANICTIWKGTVPDGIISGGYSQAQNDSDKSDFENNYQSTANGSLSPQAVYIPGYVSTSDPSIVACRATLYNEQSTGAQRSISSSSANDASAGTGARTVLITYYDSTLTNLETETVTLNGTTPVDTIATDICFIEKMTVVQVGSAGGNVGTINLFVGTAGSGGTIGTIAPGDNQTNWCHHYVRANHTAYVVTIHGGSKGSSNGSVTIRKAFPTSSPSQAEITFAPQLRVNAGGNQDFTFDSTPAAVSGPARITLYVQQDAASSSNSFFGGFGYYEY